MRFFWFNELIKLSFLKVCLFGNLEYDFNFNFLCYFKRVLKRFFIIIGLVKYRKKIKNMIKDNNIVVDFVDSNIFYVVVY